MRLFVSYAHKDFKKAQKLVDVLRETGHTPWFDEQLVSGKEEWKIQLRQAIHDADAFVYALTEASVDVNSWCWWEFVTASKLGKPIIPILLEDTELPDVISEHQHVDFRTGFRRKNIKRLLRDLTTLATVIPEEKIPETPEQIEGKPSRAVEQHVAIDGEVHGDVSIIGYIGTQILGDKQRSWTLPVIIGLLLTLVGTIAAVLALLPEPERDNLFHQVGIVGPSATPTMTSSITPTNTPTLTPTPTNTPSPTPTPTPDRMPAGAFNVVVAGFGLQETDGTVIQSALADDMSDIVFNSIADLAQVDYIQGWRDTGVGHILASDPKERERQAAQIAEELGADVVIYGVITNQGIRSTLEPEFYVTADFAALEPELTGADKFGDAIDFVSNSDDQLAASTELQRRLVVLRSFLKGLSLYIGGDFEASRKAFEEALEDASQGLEVLYIFAGNAAIREEEIERALEFYNESLTTRSHYARALIGRGIALYQLALQTAGDSPPPYDPDLELPPKMKCSSTNQSLPTEAQLLADLALLCYQEAELSTDKVETADIDVKISFGQGQLYVWMSLNNYGNYWNEVEGKLSEVIELYNQSDHERQARIRTMAAHANAWLGLRLLVIDGTNVDSVQQSVEFYSRAIDLLEIDVHCEYNRAWIDTYQQQVEALQDWLAARIIPTQTSSPVFK